jgi:hypothetical protein
MTDSPAGADLLVRLYELRLRDPYRSAAAWLESEFEARSFSEVEERYPAGSEGHEALRVVLDHWELVGALVHAGALDERLLFDATGEHLSVWRRLEPWLEEARDALGEPTLFENLELLVRGHASWAAAHPPKLARRAEGAV